jgi:hypothetical protein
MLPETKNEFDGKRTVEGDGTLNWVVVHASPLSTLFNFLRAAT